MKHFLLAAAAASLLFTAAYDQKGKQAGFTGGDDLTGTEWTIRYSNSDGNMEYGLLFHENGRLENHHPNEATPENDKWEQTGRTVIMKINDAYVTYTGTINGNAIEGSAVNIKKNSWKWKAVRKK